MSVLLAPWIRSGRWWNTNQGQNKASLAQSPFTDRISISGLDNVKSYPWGQHTFAAPAVGWEFAPALEDMQLDRVESRGMRDQHKLPKVFDIRALQTQTGPARIRRDSTAQRPADLGLKTPYYY